MKVARVVCPLRSSYSLILFHAHSFCFVFFSFLSVTLTWNAYWYSCLWLKLGVKRMLPGPTVNELRTNSSSACDTHSMPRPGMNVVKWKFEFVLLQLLLFANRAVCFFLYMCSTHHSKRRNARCQGLNWPSREKEMK